MLQERGDPAAEAQKHREPPHRLDEAEDAVRGEIAEELVGLKREAGAPDGRHAQVRPPALERRGQVRAVEVAGRVSGHEEDRLRHSFEPRTPAVAARAICWAQLGRKERVCFWGDSS